MQFSMSMQPEARGAGALAGAERKVGRLAALFRLWLALSPPQA